MIIVDKRLPKLVRVDELAPGDIFQISTHAPARFYILGPRSILDGKFHATSLDDGGHTSFDEGESIFFVNAELIIQD